MPTCAAPNCNRTLNDGVRFFEFPRNPTRQAQWVKNCGRENWQPTKNSRLCECHFEESQYETRALYSWKKLKSTAVPTIFDIPRCPRRYPRSTPYSRENTQSEGVKFRKFSHPKEKVSAEDVHANKAVVLQPDKILLRNNDHDTMEDKQDTGNNAKNPLEDEVKDLHLKVYQLQNKLCEANKKIRQYKEMLTDAHSTEEGSTPVEEK